MTPTTKSRFVTHPIANPIDRLTVRLPDHLDLIAAAPDGVRTNLLFFTKGAPTREVWFYERPYPPGVKSYSKTRPLRVEEFAAGKAWWGGVDRSNRVENEFAWKVSAADIKARNYNLDIRNPHSPDAISHNPDELLAEYSELQKRIAETRQQLQAVLATALFANPKS